MRCTACETENDGQVKQCSRCGARLPRSSRRRELPPFGNSWTGTGLDDRAYRLSVWGLIPVAGLALGPISMALGLTACWRGRTSAHGLTVPAVAALIIGGTVTLANWVGMVLVILGWRNMTGP